jgi:PPM family protein phosphatase
MDQRQPAEQGTPLFGGRYEIVAERGGEVEAVDRQPWRTCWSCGATNNEAGELFCTQCGANLDGRRYRGQLTSDTAAGLALVTTVVDERAREMLPVVWDQVEEGGRTLTLAAESGRAPVTPPLDELDALYVARGLAALLRALHGQGLLLGEVAAADVELTAKQPRLRAAPNLRAADSEEGAAEDLRALASLLEALTATPRKTRRLEESDVPAAGGSLADVLSELRTGKIADAAALHARLEALIADRTEPQPLITRLGAASHEGMVRELDEDSLLTMELRMNRTAAPRTWGLYIVADGMGGHSAGEVASDLALRGAFEVVQREYLAPTVDTGAEDDEARLREVVRAAILQANEYVLREARSRGNDMGTTITMALVAGDRAVVGNVGDSRTYLLRDGALRRVSKDHSLVQRLVDIGQITDDEIYTHPQRNAVMRSLGDKQEIEVDLFSERLRPGDALLLVSDGQWEMTRDPQMAEIIAANPDPQAACEELVRAANAAGGDDNITVVLVKFEAP